jgi:L-threonylcarbamoyladenylate synthase
LYVGKELTGVLTRKLSEEISKGVEIVRRGGIVAFPTDTVYGVGAGAYIDAAVERVFAVKDRPRDMALPLLLADVSQVHEIAAHVPEYAWRLIKSFLPGGLTLVVHRSSVVSDIITGGRDTVSFRIPDHPIPIALIRGSGMPLVGTSANISGQPSVTSAEEVLAQIGARVDMVMRGGPAPCGKESTVVDATGEAPVVLREGVISRGELAKVVTLAGSAQ